MKLTVEHLIAIFPATPRVKLLAWVEPLNAACAKFDITTPLRLSAFIAQVGHESGGLLRTIENLNYSAQGLRAVFPKYFPTDALARSYARQPERIAARVYGSRMGNGPEATGEGWKYRGRGLIQLTGKANYQAFATAMSMKLDEVIAYLDTWEGAAMSAAWFWSKHDLNRLADRADMLTLTRRINGGQNGLDHRLALYRKACSVIR